MESDDLLDWRIVTYRITDGSAVLEKELNILIHTPGGTEQCGRGEVDCMGRWHCKRCGRRVPIVVADLCLLAKVRA